MITSIIVHAQSHFLPFTEQGKEWTVDEWAFTGLVDIAKWRFDGDTIIAEKYCLKLFQDDKYQGACYDEDGRVFFFAKEKEEAHLLYDFNCLEGDVINSYSVETNEYRELTVRNLSIEDYYGTVRRRLSFDKTSDWIEGIGSITYPLGSWRLGATGDHAFRVRKCTIAGETAYYVEPYNSVPMYIEDPDFYAGCAEVPFCQEHKKWYVQETVNESTERLVREYELAGDTLIGNTLANKMYCDSEYVGAFYEKDRYQVYFIAPHEIEGRHFYNFSIWQNDHVRVWNGTQWATLLCTRTWPSEENINVAWMNFMEIEDALLNSTLKMKDKINAEAGAWYEGVGSLHGPMDNWISPFADDGVTRTLLACRTPNEILYDPHNLVGIREHLNIDGTNTKTYDLFGRKSSDVFLKGGIIIKDGKRRFDNVFNPF